MRVPQGRPGAIVAAALSFAALRRHPRRNLLALLSLAWECAFAECGHIIHPARVRPGFSLDVVTGVDAPHHGPVGDYAPNPSISDFEPYRSADFAFQLAFTRGWRMDNGQALQLKFSVGVLSTPTVDGYWQFLDGPIDIGAGVTAGFWLSAPILPSGYVMVGHGFPLGSVGELRLDAGYRYIPSEGSTQYRSSGHGPMGLVTFAQRGFAVGLWIDALAMNHTIFRNHCDDACDEDDTMSSQVSGGLFLGYTL